MASNAWLVCAVVSALCWQGTGTPSSLRLPLNLRLRGGEAPGKREGDWKCLSCNDFNFRWRKECHRCNAARGNAKGVSAADAKSAASPARPSSGGKRSNEPLWDEKSTLNDHEKGRLIALREAQFGPDGKRDPGPGGRTDKKPGKRTRSPAQETPKSGGSSRARRRQRANPNSEKNELKELCTALGLPVPEYATTISGPENAPTFQSRVEAGRLVRTVSGRNKRFAEDGASLLVLAALRATSPASSPPTAPPAALRPPAVTPGPAPPQRASPPSIVLRGAPPLEPQLPSEGGGAPPSETVRAASPHGLVWGKMSSSENTGAAAPGGGEGAGSGAVPEVGGGGAGVVELTGGRVGAEGGEGEEQGAGMGEGGVGLTAGSPGASLVGSGGGEDGGKMDDGAEGGQMGGETGGEGGWKEGGGG
jgi:hypothetical protein